MAAWLHDVGKITTPEPVVDKSTKLEKVHDRIEEVKTRFELLKREYQLMICQAQNKPDALSPADAERELKTLDEEFEFLRQLNYGSEFTQDKMIERIRQIAKRQWQSGNNKRCPC